MEFRTDNSPEKKALFGRARQIVDGEIALEKGRLRENIKLVRAALAIASRDKGSDERARKGGKYNVGSIADEPDVIGNYPGFDLPQSNIFTRNPIATNAIGSGKYRK